MLLVDLDAQLSATRWPAAALNGVGLYEVLTAAPDAPRLVDLVCPSGVDGLDVVAGSRYLSGVERAMAREPVGAEMVLRTALAGLPAGRWDVVLLDCPPALGLLSISAWWRPATCSFRSRPR